jgi:hypothetical protein
MEKMTDVGQKKYVLSRDKDALVKEKECLESDIEALEKENIDLDNTITKLDGEVKELEKSESLAKSELATVKNKYEKATDKGFGITLNELFTQMEYLVTETNSYYGLSFNYTPLYSINSDGDTTVEFIIATDKNNISVLSHVIVLTKDNVHVKKATTIANTNIDDENYIRVCGAHISMLATALIVAMDSPFDYDSQDEDLDKNISALLLQDISNDGRIKFNTIEKQDYVIFEFEPSKKVADKKKY